MYIEDIHTYIYNILFYINILWHPFLHCVLKKLNKELSFKFVFY